MPWSDRRSAGNRYWDDLRFVQVDNSSDCPGAAATVDENIPKFQFPVIEDDRKRLILEVSFILQILWYKE